MTMLFGFYLITVVIASALWFCWALMEWPVYNDPDRKKRAAEVLRTYPRMFVWPLVVFEFIMTTLKEGEE